MYYENFCEGEFTAGIGGASPYSKEQKVAFAYLMDKVRQTFSPFICQENISDLYYFPRTMRGGEKGMDQGMLLITSIFQKYSDRTMIDAPLFLLMAAEYMDIETSSHIKRISQYSCAISRALGLSKEESSIIMKASSFHDIGKLLIPASILIKPRQLLLEERSVMENHTVFGAEMMANMGSPVFDLGSLLALTHHEKWDGTGYPDGLSGDEIPIAGRIVALADVFDALTTTRPYKQAWSVEDALYVIRKDSGSHFDPKVVTCFLEILVEVLDIYLTNTLFA